MEAVAAYTHGSFTVSVPGYTPAFPVETGQGIFVLSSRAFAWMPATGAPYTTGQPVQLQPGWNLAAAPAPYEGLDGATLDSELGGSSQCGLQEAAMLKDGTYITFLHGSPTPDFRVTPSAGVWLDCTRAYGWVPGT